MIYGCLSIGCSPWRILKNSLLKSETGLSLKPESTPITNQFITFRHTAATTCNISNRGDCSLGSHGQKLATCAWLGPIFARKMDRCTGDIWFQAIRGNLGLFHAKVGLQMGAFVRGKPVLTTSVNSMWLAGIVPMLLIRSILVIDLMISSARDSSRSFQCLTKSCDCQDRWRCHPPFSRLRTETTKDGAAAWL